MLEAEFRKTVGNSIAYYRRLNSLTQTALAQKLNYSDKAISKWERGDSLPDTYVLFRISEIFGITVNDLTQQKSESEKIESFLTEREKQREKNFRHGMITALSVGIVWLSVSVIYFLSDIIVNSYFNLSFEYLWLIFIFAIPVSFIVSLVFAALWGQLWQTSLCVSGILWGGVVCVLLSFSASDFAATGKYNIFIAAGVFQVLIVLWSVLRKKQRKHKNEKQHNERITVAVNSEQSNENETQPTES